MNDSEVLAFQVSHFIHQVISRDFFHWLHCEGCFKGSPVIKHNYLACLEFFLWFIFAINDLFVCMVYWKEAYSEPCHISKVELFGKLVSNWKLLIFFTKNSILGLYRILNTPHLYIKSKLFGQGLLYIAIWNNMYLLPFQYN